MQAVLMHETGDLAEAVCRPLSSVSSYALLLI